MQFAEISHAVLRHFFNFFEFFSNNRIKARKDLFFGFPTLGPTFRGYVSCFEKVNSLKEPLSVAIRAI